MRDLDDLGHADDSQEWAVVLIMYFKSILTISRDVSERSIIQEVLRPCEVLQLGAALHNSIGKLQTHGLYLCWTRRIEIMVVLKHHTVSLTE